MQIQPIAAARPAYDRRQQPISISTSTDRPSAGLLHVQPASVPGYAATGGLTRHFSAQSEFATQVAAGSNGLADDRQINDLARRIAMARYQSAAANRSAAAVISA